MDDDMDCAPLSASGQLQSDGAMGLIAGSMRAQQQQRTAGGGGEQSNRSAAVAESPVAPMAMQLAPPVDHPVTLAGPSASAVSMQQQRSPPSATAAVVQAAGGSSSAAASSTSFAQPPPPMTMLRCFAKCRDLQFVLMQMLTLGDLAALDGTCRSWREWLLHPPLLGGLHYRPEGTLLQLEPLAASAWTRSLVTSVLALPADSHGRGPLPPAQPTAWSRLLALLPRFTRLHWLVLVPPACSALPALQPNLSECFTALSGSLRCLALFSHGGGQAAYASVNSLLPHVALLQQLEELDVIVLASRDARALHLTQLPLLSSLNSFRLQVRGWNGELLLFRCTPIQTQSLAQCRQLTRLDCGDWSPDQRVVDDEGWQLPSAEQQIADGIATLVRGLTSAGGSSADSSSSSSSSSCAGAAHSFEAAAPCALQYLNLEDTSITAEVWEHVSRLTSLTVLCPVCWRSNLSPQQWARLADFTQLRSISIATHPDDARSDAPLRTEQFLPPMLQCTQLTSVRLRGASLDLSLNTAQLDGLASLPRLSVLELSQVEVESVAPLIHAVKLETLVLHLCSGPPGAVDFRRSMPPMPALTLTDRCRLTPAQAAPLNAALLARMPLLSQARFTQHLLDE